MNLVIVESPTKARTIGKFLGKDFVIKASMGHVMDLPKSTLGVDTEKDFKPQFELMADKSKVVAELKSAAKSASSVILATDPDREGEAIASHVKDVLAQNQKSNIKDQKFKRIVFHEITSEAIEEALKNPRSIDLHLVDAQTARRVLDRLVGYKLSPLLWQKVRRGLSAGRVQSVALRLIVEREKEIEKFKKEEYWTIGARFKRGSKSVILGSEATPGSLRNVIKQGDSGQARMTSSDAIEFELIEINGVKIETSETFNLYDGEYKVTKTTIPKEEQAQKIADDIKTKGFQVADVTQKETRRSPAPPYTTSTLQQDGARRLGLNGKRTMSLAQKLYEEGYITYHRTDSVAMAHSAQGTIIGFVKKEFGEKYVQPRTYSTKQKLAQEAHEAIRPTAVGQISNIKYQISNIVGDQGWKLYEMIWKRAVASQMADAIIESTSVLADSEDRVQKTDNRKQKTENPEDLSSVSSGIRPPTSDLRSPKYRFKANGSVLKFDGFLKVNPQALQDTRLPEYKTGEQLDLVNVDKEFHETPPPPRYNDASLIKTLEEKGIGRPSTYASIISVIEERRYVERSEGRFTPTPIGVAVNDFLVKNFSDIDDIPFTAEMEGFLDEIANGRKEWEPMIRQFYIPFEKKLENVKDKAERVKIAVEETDEICPTCGAKLVVRTGRFGKFLSCSTFPKCDFSKPFVVETGITCPKDGGMVIEKKTRRGRTFYGCSNYPKCDFAAWNLNDIRNYDPNKPQRSAYKKRVKKPDLNVKKVVERN